jgi:hypothetical protein
VVFTSPDAIDGMFAADEVLLDLGFGAAVARLAEVSRGGLLTRVSQGAYGDGIAGLAWAGPPGVSKLAEVHFLDKASAVSPPCCRCAGRPPGRAGRCSRAWTPTLR